MKEINLKVTVDEANLILEGIGKLPFEKVYGLVAQIQQQAKEQLTDTGPAAGEHAPEPGPAIKEE